MPVIQGCAFMHDVDIFPAQWLTLSTTDDCNSGAGETGQNCTQPAGVCWLSQGSGRLHEAPIAFNMFFGKQAT